MEENIKKSNAVGDAARSKVAMNKRLNLGNNMVIMAGFVIVVSSLMVGGGIGAAFPPRIAIPIILFAALSNSFIAVLIGTIGARTGYSSALVYRFAFGKYGTIVPNLAMAFSGMGWFSVIVATTKDSIMSQFGISSTAMNYIILIVVGILFIAPAFKSVKWIGYVNYVAVPALIIIIVWTSITVITNGGGFSGIFALSTAPSMTVMMGFSTAAGGWLQGATVTPDLTRFCKNGKQAIWTMLFSFGLLTFLQFSAAAIATAATGNYNIFDVLIHSGIGIVAFIAVFLGSWSTGQGIIYGASLQCAAPPTPEVKNQEYTRKMWVVILWLIALIGGLLGLEKIVNWWNSFLSILVGPLAIIVILDYYAFPERQKLYESGQDPDMKWNPAAITAWAVAFVIGFITNQMAFFVPVLTGMIVAAVIYYPWMKSNLKKKAK